MALRRRLLKLERGARPHLRNPPEGRDPVADEACERLSDREVDLLHAVIQRSLARDGDGPVTPELGECPEEQEALEAFLTLYEEMCRGLEPAEDLSESE